MNLDRILNMIFRMAFRRGLATFIRKLPHLFEKRVSKADRANQNKQDSPSDPNGPWSDKSARKLRERHRTMRRM